MGKIDRENKKAIDNLLKRFSSITDDGFECGHIDRTELAGKMVKYLDSNGELNIFNLPVFTVTADSYRYMTYDSNASTTIKLVVTTGLSQYTKGNLLVHYSDIVLMACSVIRPSNKLRKMVSDYLGIDGGLNKIKDKDLEFPKELIERSISILDMNTDISFGIQLFTVIYNQCKVMTRDLSYFSITPSDSGADLSVKAIKAEYIPLFKEIRNCNRVSLHNAASLNFSTIGNEVSDERLGYHILEAIILGQDLEFPTAKCMELFSNRELDLSTIKSRSMRDYTSIAGQKSVLAGISNIKKQSDIISDKIFSGFDCDAVSGIISRPVIPDNMLQSYARIAVIENYLYGIFGDVILAVSANSNPHKVASMIAETTRDLTGSEEHAYIDYYYATAIARTLEQKYDLLIKSRELYVKLFDNIFNSKVETVSVDYLKEVTGNYEEALKEKQLIVNSLESKVDKLTIQVQDLTEVKEEIKDTNSEEIEEDNIFISKNINELDICIVADLSKTKFVETLKPLFGSVTILDNEEAYKHDYRSYDYVIFRGDLISHSLVYKIKSDNKRVIYVEKPDARNWLPTIISRIN